MKKYYKRLNDFMDWAKDFYYFNEEGDLYSHKRNRLKPLKIKNDNSNGNGSFVYMSIDGTTKSINKKTLINLYKIKDDKKYLFDEVEQLELDLDIKTKEVNTDDLKQLSSFDSKYKDCYYFDKDGKLYNAQKDYKELTLHQKNKSYQPYTKDNKIAPITPNYLRALCGKGFENAVAPIENEEWKWIEGYEGIYKVSNFGRVANSKGLRKQFLVGRENDKYYYCLLSKEGDKKQYRTHTLVAKAFCEGYEEGLVVNHKDLNKENNHYSNLEWITQYENIQHYHQNKNKLVS